LLLSISFTSLGLAGGGQSAKVFVDPKVTYGHPEGMDSEFVIEVKIEEATNLYAFGFELHFAPLEKIITPLLTDEPHWEEGPFLKSGGTTFFAMSYDKVAGIIYFGCTLTGEVPGVDGAGTLVRVRFQVLEAGESPLDIQELTLYDNMGAPIGNHHIDGFYQGPTIDLIQKHLAKHAVKVGETQVLSAKVRNDGDVPLYAKARFEMMHEDGRYWNLWSGQTPLETSSYDGWMQWQYPTTAGDFTGDPATCLHGEEGMNATTLRPFDGLYIEEYLQFGPLTPAPHLFYCLADVGYWEFDDFVIPEGQEIISVKQRVNAWADHDLPSDMVDMFLWNGEAEILVWSMGYESHLYNAAPAFYEEDVTFLYDTEEKLNNAALWMEFFPYIAPGVEGTSAPATTYEGLPHYGYAYFTWNPAGLPIAYQVDNFWEAIYIDSIELVVETMGAIEPGEEVWLAPVELGPMTSQDIGMYYGTCTVWFGYFKPLGGPSAPTFNAAKKTATFAFQVKP
jgi:hypothetical protein